MKLEQAEQFVQAIERQTRAQWNKLSRHVKYASFMDEYFTAKCMTDFWTYMYDFLYFKNRKYYHPPFHGNDRNTPHYQSCGVAAFLQDWTVEEHGQRIPVEVK